MATQGEATTIAPWGISQVASMLRPRFGEPHYSIICHGLSDIAGEAGRIGGKLLRSIKAELAAPSCRDRICAQKTRFVPASRDR